MNSILKMIGAIATALCMTTVTWRALAQVNTTPLPKVNDEGAIGPVPVPPEWSRWLVEHHEAITSDQLRIHVFRLRPGDDLLETLKAYVQQNHIQAAVLLSAVGSLTNASIRYANQPKAKELTGHFEIVSITGTIEDGGEHIHLSIATEKGNTIGGHLMPGCKIYTTCEVTLGEIVGVQFTRELDKKGSGWNELKVYPLSNK